MSVLAAPMLCVWSTPLHSVKTTAYVAQVFNVAFLLDDSTVQHFLPNWVYDDGLRLGIPHTKQWRTRGALHNDIVRCMSFCVFCGKAEEHVVVKREPFVPVVRREPILEVKKESVMEEALRVKNQ